MTTFSHPVTGPPRASFGVTPGWAAAFLLAHVPLGLAMRANPVVSTTHALVVLGLGIGWAFAGYENRVALWGGYVAASDVLWRMTGASIQWEFAKYALALVFAFAILRSGRLRGPALPFIYMGLLIPSSILVAQLVIDARAGTAQNSAMSSGFHATFARVKELAAVFTCQQPR